MLTRLGGAWVRRALPGPRPSGCALAHLGVTEALCGHLWIAVPVSQKSLDRIGLHPFPARAQKKTSSKTCSLPLAPAQAGTPGRCFSWGSLSQLVWSPWLFQMHRCLWVKELVYFCLFFSIEIWLVYMIFVSDVQHNFFFFLKQRTLPIWDAISSTQEWDHLT